MEQKVKDSIQFIRDLFHKSNGPVIASTSCGATSGVLIDLVARSQLPITIVFVNTNYMFTETLGYFEYFQEQYPSLKFEEVKSFPTKEAFEREHGAELYRFNPDKCCHINKVKPLTDYIEKHQVGLWLSGVGSDQNEKRKQLPKVQHLEGGLVKVLPVFEWTADEVISYLEQRGIQMHPLFDQGYESIGCEPCTKFGKGRQGRWP